MEIRTQNSTPPLIIWLRWIAMPFAAFIGALITSALAIAFMWFTMKLHGGMTTDGWYFRFVMPVISSALYGYFYTRIACYVAPSGKFITGIVMLTVLGMIALMGNITMWLSPNYHASESILATITGIAMIAAGIPILSEQKSSQIQSL